jgi:hypothetical protein
MRKVCWWEERPEAVRSKERKLKENKILKKKGARK